MHLYELANDYRAEWLFAVPVPEDCADFVDSIADQFLASAGILKWDEELRALHEQARADIEKRLANCSAKAGEYLTQARNILADLGANAPTKTAAAAVDPQIIRICFDLECTHPTGKFDPFKKKLSALKDDGVQFDRADKKAILRFDLIARHDHAKGPKGFAAFNRAVEKTLLKLGKWLAKQSPSAFEEARQAGYEMRFVFSVLQHAGQDAMTLDLPTAFVTECGKHGLAISSVHEYHKP